MSRQYPDHGTPAHFRAREESAARVASFKSAFWVARDLEADADNVTQFSSQDLGDRSEAAAGVTMLRPPESQAK